MNSTNHVPRTRDSFLPFLDVDELSNKELIGRGKSKPSVTVGILDFTSVKYRRCIGTS